MSITPVAYSRPPILSTRQAAGPTQRTPAVGRGDVLALASREAKPAPLSPKAMAHSRAGLATFLAGGLATATAAAFMFCQLGALPIGLPAMPVIAVCALFFGGVAAILGGTSMMSVAAAEARK